MFKCLDCGHIFEEGEQATREERHPYGSTTASEYFAVCPVCGGDFEEAACCEKCGGVFLEEELVAGCYCKECLKKAVTYDSFLGFATSGVRDLNKPDVLEDFILREFLDVHVTSGEILTCSSSTLKTFARNMYHSAARSDELGIKLVGKSELLKTISNYLTNWELWDAFAEYLHDKEVRK